MPQPRQGQLLEGLKEKDGAFKKSVFGVTLAGCPLEEKISEMNLVKARGNSLGALAIVAVDNPICAATGHRICNDCMKACIYQRQDPVDIPQVETGTLKDVLGLPWGFEIYSLLTRWNPLNVRRPLPRRATGRKVLVVGLGPAGFTLAHHLLNDGHFVAAIDGLKLEPLPPEICGIAQDGARRAFAPIRDITRLVEGLDDKVMAGFGGVAEYGITVRWDKNFLKIVRLLLERRANFAMYGGIRFGGTITIDSAFDLGFDHVALCAGAGRPTVIPMKNGLAPGVRQASDFLMALQLTGAAKTDSIANLTVRLPVVVIGGGLTAIDTATESLAYYPVQVEKFLSRYETLVAERGEEAVRAEWDAAEREIAAEFVAHGRAIRAEREAARREARAPRLAELLDSWGGVTIAYRRRLTDLPSHPQPRGGSNTQRSEAVAGTPPDERLPGHLPRPRHRRRRLGRDLPGRRFPANDLGLFRDDRERVGVACRLGSTRPTTPGRLRETRGADARHLPGHAWRLVPLPRELLLALPRGLAQQPTRPTARPATSASASPMTRPAEPKGPRARHAAGHPAPWRHPVRVMSRVGRPPERSEEQSTDAEETPAMSHAPHDGPVPPEQGSRKLMLLLAMAMFVLVVDTSLMNVSISAVITDLDTTASGVQSAIALEALVSAAFILINSKVGDLIGRKRAYVLGLLAYAVGALAMTLAQSLTAIVIFWAIIGGLGASLLLPAMQSLIHGNFAGAAQKQAYALVGAAAAIAAAIGPLLGGFVTTYLSWRVGFALEVVIIAVVLSQIRLVRDVPYTGSRQVDVVGAVLSVIGMGGVVLGILVWQEGGEFVGLLMAVGAVALGCWPGG